MLVRWLNPFVWWRRTQRRIDLSVLWPACLEKAPTRMVALKAFGLHVAYDTAWHVDEWEYTAEELALLRECVAAAEGTV